MTTDGEMDTAAVLVKQGDLQLRKVSSPNAPQAGEVLVAMKSVGICGSDVHYLKHGRIGDFVVREPMIIGHESAGEIVEVGPGVTNLQRGDRVALEPGIPCRKCLNCRTGSYNLCPDVKFFATPPIDGSLRSHVVHPADFCFKLPDSVSFEDGAMCEPLSVGVYACERAGVKPGCTVAVFGAGPIGLVCSLAAKAFGADNIVITDIEESRVKFARSVGIQNAICVRGKQKDEVVSEIREVFGGQADVSIECCGNETATRTAISACRSGGTCVCVGMGAPDMNLPVMDCFIREIDLRGVFRYRNTYPTCISLLSRGLVNVSPLITHRFDPFQDNGETLRKAFDIAADPKSGAIKVMFNLP
eukprot:181007_1